MSRLIDKSQSNKELISKIEKELRKRKRVVGKNNYIENILEAM